MKSLFLLMLFSGLVFAQDNVEKIFDKKTKIENPLDLRDPFRAPVMKRERRDGLTDQNIQTPEEILQGINVADIIVHGVLIGKERRAYIKSKQKADVHPVLVKEGYRIGPDRVEVKAILPGGIILVEKMVNVYGQEEYLETVIPITK